MVIPFVLCRCTHYFCPIPTYPEMFYMNKTNCKKSSENGRQDITSLIMSVWHGHVVAAHVVTLLNGRPLSIHAFAIFAIQSILTHSYPLCGATCCIVAMLNKLFI